jgi:hypothetical protein
MLRRTLEKKTCIIKNIVDGSSKVNAKRFHEMTLPKLFDLIITCISLHDIILQNSLVK